MCCCGTCSAAGRRRCTRSANVHSGHRPAFVGHTAQPVRKEQQKMAGRERRRRQRRVRHWAVLQGICLPFSSVVGRHRSHGWTARQAWQSLTGRVAGFPVAGRRARRGGLSLSLVVVGYCGGVKVILNTSAALNPFRKGALFEDRLDRDGRRNLLGQESWAGGLCQVGQESRWAGVRGATGHYWSERL